MTKNHTAAQTTPAERPPLLGTLCYRMALQLADQHPLLAAALPPRQIAKGESIVEEDDPLSSLLLLCGGAAQGIRTLEDGSQQMAAFFVSGDALNPGDLALGRSRISIRTLTPALVLAIPLTELDALMETRPAVARGLWRETAFQASIQREWLAWLGRKSAEARLSHFLCEVAYRLKTGEDDCDVFDLPLTQHELADVLGVSVVHVNRVLQQLRKKNLIDLQRSRLTIRNREGLYAVAEFDPAYLQISETSPIQ